MKFLIAGLGSIGRRHLRNLIALGERDIVLYRTGKSTLPDEGLEQFPTENTLDDALGHDPDAVIVSNPTALHMQVAIPAARSGSHLLIEKPLSDSTESLDTLSEAVTEGGGKVLVGFQLRYHPTLQDARQNILAESLGRVISVRAHWGEHLPDWHPWEDFRSSYAARADLGGGVLLTLCHPLDYLMWIFGDIDAVQGMYERGLGLDVEAVVEAVLHFRSGALGSVHLDYIQKPPQHSLTVVGEKGHLHWDGLSGALEIQRSPDNSSQLLNPPEGFERNDLFVAELSHFLKVIDGSEEPTCTLAQGLRVQETIGAIRQTYPGFSRDKD